MDIAIRSAVCVLVTLVGGFALTGLHRQGQDRWKGSLQRVAGVDRSAQSSHEERSRTRNALSRVGYRRRCSHEQSE